MGASVCEDVEVLTIGTMTGEVLKVVNSSSPERRMGGSHSTFLHEMKSVVLGADDEADEYPLDLRHTAGDW